MSRLLIEYEITDATGTRRASEVHELGLFTTAEMLQTFQEAGPTQITTQEVSPIVAST